MARHPRRGSVLMYVVWVVLLLSLLAASVGSQALFALDLSERLTEQLRAGYVARGAVQLVSLAVRRDRTPATDGLNDSWATAAYNSQPLAGGSFTLLPPPAAPGAASAGGLEDEERRINLNTAPGDVLARLLATAGGMVEHEAQDAAEAIEDWRDPDDEQRSGGAEGSYYRSLRDAYDCKDGPFESVEELLLVRGISPAVYRKIAPYVTVFGSGRVNLNTAGRPVLRALGLSETGVSGLTYFRSGEDNQEGTSDDRLLSSVGSLDAELQAFLPAEDRGRLAQLAAQQQLTVFSTAFRMTIEASTAEPHSRVTVRCVVDRQGHVKQWSEA